MPIRGTEEKRHRGKKAQGRKGTGRKGMAKDDKAQRKGTEKRHG
jgi:hypothetical protein